MGEIAVKSEEDTDSHKLLVQSVIGIWWQGEYGFAIARRVVKCKNLLCYGMQRYKSLYVRLLTALTDESPAFGISLDVFWAKSCQVNVSQSREYCKKQHVSCQFHLSLLERMGKQHLYLFTGQIADFHVTLHFLIFDVLQRIGAQYLLVNSQKHKAAQPCQTVIGSRRAEVLPLSEIDVVVFP